MRSFVEYYNNLEGQDFLDHFNARENIRRTLANFVITQINDEYNKCNFSNPNDLISVIMEDLRTPYYKHLFTNNNAISSGDLTNTALIKRIKADITAESIMTEFVKTDYPDDKHHDTKRKKHDR